MHTIIDTRIGELTVVGDGTSVTGIYYPRHWTRPDRAAWGERVTHAFDAARVQLAEYLEGTRRAFDLATSAAGSDFQHRAWAAITAIEYGRTRTYGELADDLGANAREVGSAVGANPLSIVVPCHRVVGKHGSLTGYAGGLGRKRFLLDLEQDQHARLF